MVARNRLPDAEAGGQTATPSGPTASKSCAAVRLCTLPAVVMVEAIVVVSSPARANLCVLLQCGDDSEYGCKAYNGYIEVFWALLADR
jgi:hypothetical protein